MSREFKNLAIKKAGEAACLALANVFCHDAAALKIFLIPFGAAMSRPDDILPPLEIDWFPSDGDSWIVSIGLPWKYFYGIVRVQRRRPESSIEDVVAGLLKLAENFDRQWMANCEFTLFDPSRNLYQLLRATDGSTDPNAILYHMPKWNAKVPLAVRVFRMMREPWVTRVSRWRVHCRFEMSSESLSILHAAAADYDPEEKPVGDLKILAETLLWLLKLGILRDDAEDQGNQLLWRPGRPWQESF